MRHAHAPTDMVVFFDVGGTLLEVSPSVGHVYAEACGRLGAAVQAEEVQRAFDRAWVQLSREVPPGADRYRVFPGGEIAWWEKVSACAFELCGVPASRRPPVADLRAVFAGAGAWKIFPETREALSELRRRGYRLGVLSNWDSRLPDLLETLELRAHFDAIIYSAAAGFEKPHPRIFAAALEAFGVEASRAVHVGDRMEEDYGGARAAGMRALLVRRADAGLRPEGLRGPAAPVGAVGDEVQDLSEAVKWIVG